MLVSLDWSSVEGASKAVGSGFGGGGLSCRWSAGGLEVGLAGFGGIEHEEHRQGDTTQAVGSSGAAARLTLPHPHGTPVKIGHSPPLSGPRGLARGRPRFAFKGRQTALPSHPLRQAGFKIQEQQAT